MQDGKGRTVVQHSCIHDLGSPLHFTRTFLDEPGGEAFKNLFQNSGINEVLRFGETAYADVFGA
jgi:hypothetical protein